MATINQIAMSVTDLPATHRWYCQLFGYQPAGGTSSFKGWIASNVQGIPDVASTCWWLVDRQEYFQLELFEFSQPAVKPLAADWRPCDIGYSQIGIWVADMDVCLGRLAQMGVETLTPPMGDPGQRRVCARDPEGVLLEILEQDPLQETLNEPARPDLQVRTCSVSVSVPSLEQSLVFFRDVLGLAEYRGTDLHCEQHEALWGLTGARRKSCTLRAGDVLVELVQYLDPIGKDWPDGYRISDQGLLNIALGFRDKAEFNAVHQRCLAAGVKGNWRPLNLGAWSVVYVNDDQGFSVELLHVRPWYDGRMGFKPKPAPKYRRIAA